MADVIAEPIAVSWTPACMTDAEWRDWQRLNPTNGRILADRPCADCPLGYAAEMRAVSRCNGTPGGVEEDEEMGTFDYTSGTTAVPDTAALRTLPPGLGRAVELEVTAPPCGSCAHEPVCALRAAFEGMATVETSAPSLPDGLRLSLSASVTCEHFLRDRAKPAPVRALTPQERGQANGAGAARKSHEWTPEQRAAQGDRMRARNAAAQKGVATG